MENYQPKQQEEVTQEQITHLCPFPPLPLPLPFPLPITKKPPIKFTLSEAGDLNFQGEINEETYLLIEQAITASQMKTKLDHQLKLKEVSMSKDVDAIVIVFTTCVLSLTVFFTYSITSMIFGSNHKKAEVTQSVKV